MIFLVLARYSAKLNGLDSIALTRLDTLSGFKEIKICTAYKINGQSFNTPPATFEELNISEPIYESFNGWEEDVSEARTFNELPKNAQVFVDKIASFTDVPIDMISVGPEREQAIIVKKIFD